MTAQHRSRRLSRVLAAGVVAAALAAPPALAGPIDPPVPRDPGTRVAADPEPAPVPAPVVQTIDDGFDWGSAAIGAGGAGALIVIASLGSFAYTSRHRIGVAR